MQTDFWTLSEKARVQWLERIALKHVYYHMWNRWPLQVWCMKQGTQSRCSGTTQRDSLRREVEGGSGSGGSRVSVADWFMLTYVKNQHNIVKWLELCPGPPTSRCRLVTAPVRIHTPKTNRRASVQDREECFCLGVTILLSWETLQQSLAMQLSMGFPGGISGKEAIG